MTAYYNENDPFAAAWLKELIKDNLIAPGDVDERSIEDVTPNDVAPYTQCHFFAGIGGWSYALRLAGWPDDRPVWTGSAPCQPFSSAGKGKGTADKRHLWPSWFWLIRNCQPATIFGEQVSSKKGLAWWDIVATDLEAAGYGCGAFDLCAAGAGAFHLRQRLYFVAHATGKGKRQISVRQGRQNETSVDISGGCDANKLANAISSQKHEKQQRSKKDERKRPSNSTSRRGLDSQGFWANVEWVVCRDGKARAIEPGIQPLAHGVPGRVGTLRGAGNAIVPQLAAEFIAAYMEVNQ